MKQGRRNVSNTGDAPIQLDQSFIESIERLQLAVAKKIYRKSSIRSRPCIILHSNFPRLVLEVFQKWEILEQNVF